MNAPVRIRRAYPTKAEIARVVEAVKACGIDVGGVEVSATGGIKITEARSMPDQTPDEFTRLEAAGLI